MRPSLEEQEEREFQRQELRKEMQRKIMALEDADEGYADIQRRERFKVFLELFYRQLCGYFGKHAHDLTDPSGVLKNSDETI